ncbi:alpha/beta fold hydrolase [Polyangium aurulentum]|uniref:alpha/beta fold hydrolase n=1 Tax=Polyangium aurulentum TaxID=2567896 RepID=UPI0010AE23CF|nr:alpha/beta fold hydrolase [Polyangium aurulentum]UQA55002.1 alpha/beta fold hydrolase [Polyangium aurulentum]
MPNDTPDSPRFFHGNGPVHVADFGGSGPPIVLVHGLGGSHVNWMSVGRALAARGRVLAPDLIGFGRTPLAGRAPSIDANVAMLARFLDNEVKEPVTLVGNSMGGLVSALVAAERPSLVSRLVLVAPALPIPPGAMIDPTVTMVFALYLVPGMGEAFLRHRMKKRGPEGVLRDTLRLCGVDPARLSPGVYEAGIALARERAEHPWADAAFLAAARSLVRTNMRRARVFDALRRIAAPTLLVHGTADRLVPFAASAAVARLRPDWTLARLEGIGHVPQLEVPERWLELIGRWIEPQSK